MEYSENVVQSYFVRIHPDERQDNMFSLCTHFFEYADDDGRIELRVPSKLSFGSLHKGYRRSEGNPLPFLTNFG